MPVSNPIIRGEGELVLWTQHQVASEGASLGLDALSRDE